MPNRMTPSLLPHRESQTASHHKRPKRRRRRGGSSSSCCDPPCWTKRRAGIGVSGGKSQWILLLLLFRVQLLCLFGSLPVAESLPTPLRQVRRLGRLVTAADDEARVVKSADAAKKKSEAKDRPLFGLQSMSGTAAAAGETALRQVQRLGRLVTVDEVKVKGTVGDAKKSEAKVLGSGGSIYKSTKEELTERSPASSKDKQVWGALANLEADMQLLDRLAGQKPQLSALEFTALSTAVLACVSGPLVLGGRLTEFVAPSAAAFTAAIGIGAEYTGKVAVADGKEVAAASIQCAAEAEGFLAQAERAKAITPLCVGLGATAATLALLVPVLMDALGVASSSNMQLITEIYLLCPLVSILSAAVAGLAVQEIRSLCNLAIGVGNRRFARSGLVGRTWLSTTELIDRKSKGAASKWKIFSLSVLPAPLLGALIPGALPTKTIVVAALAAAESAYFLARAEYILSRATDAVALKARSAAVCDTYANQGARACAILPFTSALCGLCAAATAAIVELPFVEALATAATPTGTFLEIITVSVFPFFSSLFAAAASVSKARCEVDAEAAMEAASTLALAYDDGENNPILRPISGVQELIRLVWSNSIKEPLRRFLRRLKRPWKMFRKSFRRNKL